MTLGSVGIASVLVVAQLATPVPVHGAAVVSVRDRDASGLDLHGVSLGLHGWIDARADLEAGVGTATGLGEQAWSRE